jgi:hypothetical protein
MLCSIKLTHKADKKEIIRDVLSLLNVLNSYNLLAVIHKQIPDWSVKGLNSKVLNDAQVVRSQWIGSLIFLYIPSGYYYIIFSVIRFIFFFLFASRV